MNQARYPIDLSVVFPCFNEERNVPLLVDDALRVLPGLTSGFEIIIVNDGSADGTGLIADQLADKFPEVKAAHHPKNRGYGTALITGFKQASCDWVFFTDGDRQFYLEEISKLLPHLLDYDLVIGFREKRSDPRYRRINAYMWNMAVRLLLNVHVRDIDCAFKIFKRDILGQMSLTSRGAMINAELLAKTGKLGLKVKEVGVSHRSREFGRQTGSNPKVILKALLELMKFRSAWQRWENNELRKQQPE